MQEINRGKNSKSIDIDFFCTTWKDESMHMTVSRETLTNLAQGILQAQRKGYRVEVSLAEGVDWKEEDALIYKKELEKLAEEYLKNRQLKPINILLRYGILVNPEKDKKHIQKFCGTGTYMTAYDPDGRAFGCHMFSSIVLGKRAIEKKEIDFKCTSVTDDPTCNSCVLKHFCPTCAGFNYRYRNKLGIRDKRKCALHLQEAVVSANFQLKLIAQRLNKLTEEDAQYAKQALKTLMFIKKIKDKNKYPYQIESEV